MHILGGSFRVISKLPAIVNQNFFVRTTGPKWFSSVVPVKLNFDVFSPKSPDPSLSPIIIMHGLFGSKNNWRTVSKTLSEQTSRKVYSVDARNHGDSPHASEHGSIELATDVAGLMKDERIKKACVIGHSMGGRAMMVFSLKFPHLVEKAIIVDISPTGMPKNTEFMMGIFRAMMSANAPSNLSLSQGRKYIREHILREVDGIDESTVNFILLGLAKKPSGEFEWKMNVPVLLNIFPRFRREQLFEWPPFEGPVMFACGEHSPYMDPDDWPKVKKVFPKAELKWFDSGHLVHMEQPKLFVEEVQKFLKT